MQQLDFIAVFIDKNKYIAIAGISAKNILHQITHTIETFSHVTWQAFQLGTINPKRATQLNSIGKKYFYLAITFVSNSCRSEAGYFNWNKYIGSFFVFLKRRLLFPFCTFCTLCLTHVIFIFQNSL
jgi:hypothetical protein